MQAIRAFTAKHIGKAKILRTEVDLIANRKKVTVPALWDTGATDSCISKEVAKQLKLIPTGLITIRTPSGKADVSTYLIDIILPNDLIVKGVKVCESEIHAQGLGLLIGMDIISSGDFAVSNYDGNTVFTFRHPSLSEIDFVQQLQQAEAAATNSENA